MSTPQWTPNWAPLPPQAPLPPLPPAAPKKHTGLKVVGALVAAVMLVGLGTTMSKTVTVATPPPPAVTTTVPGPTTTATKVTVPAVCLQALDAADELTVTFSETMDIVVSTFDALQRYDTKTINANVAKMEVQTKKVTNSKYPLYRESCRAQAKG